jgi:hypothetical protein
MADEKLNILITTKARLKALNDAEKKLAKLGGETAVKAQKNLNKVNRQIKMLSGTTKKSSMLFGRFTNSIAVGVLKAEAFGAALRGVRKGLEAIGGALMMAADIEVLDAIMLHTGKSAGHTAEKLLEVKEGIMKLGIAEKEAIQLEQRFIQAQLDVSKALKIARISQDAAAIARMDSSEAALQITDAINKQRPILLKQFGINVQLEKATAKYAKTLGKTRDELTSSERKQALYNAVMEESQSITGAYVTAMSKVGKQMTSLARHHKTAQASIGKLFLPVLRVAVAAAEVFLKVLTKIADELIKDAGYKEAAENVDSVAVAIKSLTGGTLQLANLFIGTGKVAKNAFELIYDSIKLVADPLNELVQAISNFVSGNWTAALLNLNDLFTEFDENLFELKTDAVEFAMGGVQLKDAITGLSAPIVKVTKEVQDLDTSIEGATTKSDDFATTFFKLEKAAQSTVNGMEAHNDLQSRFGKNLTFAAKKVENLEDKVASLIRTISGGNWSISKFAQLLGFIPGLGAVGTIGGALPFDDPVNDASLTREFRRIGNFISKGLGQSALASKEPQLAGVGGGSFNIENLTVNTNASDPKEVAREISNLSKKDFTDIQTDKVKIIR